MRRNKQEILIHLRMIHRCVYDDCNLVEVFPVNEWLVFSEFPVPESYYTSRMKRCFSFDQHAHKWNRPACRLAINDLVDMHDQLCSEKLRNPLLSLFSVSCNCVLTR